MRKRRLFKTFYESNGIGISCSFRALSVVSWRASCRLCYVWLGSLLSEGKDYYNFSRKYEVYSALAGGLESSSSYSIPFPGQGAFIRKRRRRISCSRIPRLLGVWFAVESHRCWHIEKSLLPKLPRCNELFRVGLLLSLRGQQELSTQGRLEVHFAELMS